MFNKEKPIEYMVEVNIYYQGYREKIEIDVTGGQKQSIILEMLQLAHHNSEINWKIEKMKMTRCPEEYGKQQRLKQEKSGWEKQKEEKEKEEKEKK